MEVGLDFRNGGPLSVYERWIFRGNHVHTTSVYKNKGMLCTHSLSWYTVQQKLAMQAQKASYAIYRYQRCCGIFTVNQLYTLIDTMVRPTLCYGSHITSKYASVIENVQKTN